MEGMPAREGATTMWQSGQAAGEQSVWLWHTTPNVIVSIAATSTIGTTTRQNLVLPGILLPDYFSDTTLNSLIDWDPVGIITSV